MGEGTTESVPEDMKWWREIRGSDGPVYVRRWNNIVHIVRSGVPDVFGVDRHGHVVMNTFPATMACGVKAKLNVHSTNRVVIDAPTCIQCIYDQIEQDKVYAVISAAFGSL